MSAPANRRVAKQVNDVLSSDIFCDHLLPFGWLPNPKLKQRAAGKKNDSIPAPVAANPLPVSFVDLDLSKLPDTMLERADVVDHLPKTIKSLDGKKIRICGYMMPTFETTDLESFVLERGVAATGFGRRIPYFFEMISVKLKPDVRCDGCIDYKPLEVIGTLKIEVVAENGKPLGLYWIEDGEIAVTKRQPGPPGD